MYFIACLYEEDRRKKLFVSFSIYGINAICDILSVYSLNNYVYGKEKVVDSYHGTIQINDENKMLL